jgi:hypothetical protein
LLAVQQLLCLASLKLMSLALCSTAAAAAAATAATTFAAAVVVTTGSRMDLFMWARSPSVDNQVNIEYVLLDAANNAVGSKFDAFALTKGVITRKYQQFPLVS